jgi:hypothetical protein
MRVLLRLVDLLAGVTLAVWLGSIVHMLVVARAVFSQFPRQSSDIGKLVNPVLFHATEPIHVGLGVASILLLALGQMPRGRRRARAAAMALAIVATTAACASQWIITPKIDELAPQRAAREAEFGKWHGISGAVYIAQALCVLGAVVTMPSIHRSTASPVLPQRA